MRKHRVRERSSTDFTDGVTYCDFESSDDNLQRGVSIESTGQTRTFLELATAKARKKLKLRLNGTTCNNISPNTLMSIANSEFETTLFAELNAGWSDSADLVAQTEARRRSRAPTVRRSFSLSSFDSAASLTDQLLVHDGLSTTIRACSHRRSSTFLAELQSAISSPPDFDSTTRSCSVSGIRTSCAAEKFSPPAQALDADGNRTKLKQAMPTATAAPPTEARCRKTLRLKSSIAVLLPSDSDSDGDNDRARDNVLVDYYKPKRGNALARRSEIAPVRRLWRHFRQRRAAAADLALIEPVLGEAGYLEPDERRCSDGSDGSDADDEGCGPEIHRQPTVGVRAALESTAMLLPRGMKQSNRTHIVSDMHAERQAGTGRRRQGLDGDCCPRIVTEQRDDCCEQSVTFCCRQELGHKHSQTHQ